MNLTTRFDFLEKILFFNIVTFEYDLLIFNKQHRHIFCITVKYVHLHFEFIHNAYKKLISDLKMVNNVTDLHASLKLVTTMPDAIDD